MFFKNPGFIRFLEEARLNPTQYRQYRFDDPIDITVSFNPSQTSAGMTHFDYRQTNLIERNSTFQALMRKYDQLENSNYPGLKGVILCNSGADLFNNLKRVSAHLRRGSSCETFLERSKERSNWVCFNGNCNVHKNWPASFT